YGEYTYAAIHRSQDGGASADWINGLFWNGAQYVCKAAPFVIVDSCNASKSNFIAPFILDPNNSNRLLVGADALWRSDDATTANTATTGPSWTSIKPASGTGNYVSAVAVANGNSSIVWVGHNNGQVYKTTNGTTAAPTWTVPQEGPATVSVEEVCFMGTTLVAVTHGRGLFTTTPSTATTPTITWATPADIVYGTALSATQLNATASTAGTFTYTPAAG